jgi:hypothetical protein
MPAFRIAGFARDPSALTGRSRRGGDLRQLDSRLQCPPVVKVVIGAVVAALLVLAGGAGGYLLARDDDSDEAAPTRVTVAGGRVLPPQPELPDPVERTRIAIAEAAAARDYDALAQLIPEDGFEYTFGGPVVGGPTAYWRRLEATTDEAPLETLVAVLALPYTNVRGIYVWPFAFDREPTELTEEELELLSTFATPREIQGWREFGGYIGYRAGIDPDGDWVFYVAGD